jgi:glycosyltransferase involved in cell wall biosynthesis
MPQVSIVIPTYNAAKYLSRSLSSVLNQTYKDFEIIVVDDGSKDNTEEVVKSFMNLCDIKYIYQENSGGPSKPRNVGIKNAKSDYIVLFDADDMLMPDCLASCKELIEKRSELGLVFTNFSKCNENGHITQNSVLDGYDFFQDLKKIKLGQNRYVIPKKTAFSALIYGDFIGRGVIVPKKIFHLIGYFDENLTNGQDKDMWLRVTREYDIGYIEMIGHYYREWDGAISKRDGIELSHNRIKVLEKQIEIGLSKKDKKTARGLIGINLYGIGYQYRKKGDMKRARKYYRKSLRQTFYRPSLQSLIISFIGIKNIELLRNMFYGKDCTKIQTK